MIAVLLTAALATLAGLILLRRSIRLVPAAALLGISFLIGTGILSAILFLLSLLDIRWSPAHCFVSLAIGMPLAWWGGALIPTPVRPDDAEPEKARWGLIADALTTLLIAGHGLFAMLAPPPENDFLSIWGLKAKVFFLAGGVDWSFLGSRWNAFCHPEYPLLLPLLYDWPSFFGHAWDDRSLGLFTTLFGAALVLIVRSLLAERAGRCAAAVATLAIASAALIPWIGLAEGPLVAFVGAAVLLLRRGIRLDCRFSLFAGSAMFGLAGCTKNEGLTFAAAAFVVLLLDRQTRRWWRQLLPAVLIPLPWVILRSWFGLHSDLFRGDVMLHLLTRVTHPGPVLAALTRERVMSTILLTGIILAIVVLRKRLAAMDRPLVIILLLQFLVCLATYFATANDVTWQIKWSWERVMTQILVPLEILLVAGLSENVEPLIHGLFRRAKRTSS